MPTSTPWGPSDSSHVIAPGIVQHSTAGHGGIHLTAERLAAMPASLAAFRTFNGNIGWYEEDADWALVALAFPHAFQPSNLASAVTIVKGLADYFGPGILAWLADSAEGKEAVAIVEAWKAANADRYRISCSGSIPKRFEDKAKALQSTVRGNLWWCMLSRISDGAEAEALLLWSEQAEPIDLSTIPPERVFIKESAHAS